MNARVFVLVLGLSCFPPVVVAGQPAAPVAEIGQLQLFSNFWLNLHHFLYVSAWARRPPHSRERRLAMPLPSGSDVMMQEDERAVWNSAVSYYDREFASRDLLFDRDLTSINTALAAAASGLDDLSLAPGHRVILEAAAPIYRRYWWSEHDAANRAWIADVARRTLPLAPLIIERLTSLYHVSWFQRPVRVDVVRVGKSQGAYTTVVPNVHIIMASADASYEGWAGTEMLFHEASHGLVEHVREAIDQAMRAAHKDPRDLWHVVLFYVSGEITRQALAVHEIEYQPYLDANGLWTNAWPTFRGPIERSVRRFVDGETTLAEMATDLAASVP